MKILEIELFAEIMDWEIKDIESALERGYIKDLSTQTLRHLIIRRTLSIAKTRIKEFEKEVPL